MIYTRIKPRLNAEAMTEIRNKVALLCNDLEDFALNLATDIVNPDDGMMTDEEWGDRQEQAEDELDDTIAVITSMIISQVKWEI